MLCQTRKQSSSFFILLRFFLSPANSWLGLGFFPSKGGKCMGYYSFDLRSHVFLVLFLEYCISRDVMQSNFFFPRGQVLVFIKDL